MVNTDWAANDEVAAQLLHRLSARRARLLQRLSWRPITDEIIDRADQARHRTPARTAAQISLAGAQTRTAASTSQACSTCRTGTWRTSSPPRSCRPEKLDRLELRGLRRTQQARPVRAGEQGQQAAGVPVRSCSARGAAVEIKACARNRQRIRLVALDDINLSVAARRIRLHRRAERLRQVHAAAHSGRPRHPDRRHDQRRGRRLCGRRTRWCSRRAACFPG